MKVTLSFEKTQTKDTSIMVDALRASTTITLALNNFNKIIPCFTPEEAFELKNKTGGILAGERNGKRVDGFDIGNSPKDVENYKTDVETLILTTSNGTRILEKMDSTVLVGSMVNAKAVGYKSVEIAKNEIDVVMAGYKGNFALEDFLASGEILYWIYKKLKDKCELSDYAKAAILASRDYDSLKKGFYNCNSGKKLTRLNSKKDIDCCVLKNISSNVAIYEDTILKLIKD
ncbi:2-phosphosulfolactate phosphatase [uncultured Methanobrevibacter sp.]|uniref:2-phosphosulfolactate phosphatase n=1 Tax=uncultured Methanobrevibacter sp. TaxID=253161 RepID=UPI002619757D|nr:2-phosphosulfolactate phosphatase [uncultured Methanobrevibacter sp.]